MITDITNFEWIERTKEKVRHHKFVIGRFNRDGHLCNYVGPWNGTVLYAKNARMFDDEKQAADESVSLNDAISSRRYNIHAPIKIDMITGAICGSINYQQFNRLRDLLKSAHNPMSRSHGSNKI